ncbi:MAG: type II CRISPR RNA-guided endonuclease Cas9 [Enterococcus sp.]
MPKYSIGLDIGIASVGWSLLNIENGEVEELGSRIFPSGNPEGNAKRRSFRGTRRLIRRRKNRLNDLRKLLESVNLPNPQRLKNFNPYELRVSALSDKLTKEELAVVLYQLVKHRGVSYDLGDINEEESSAISDYTSAIDVNRKLLNQGKTVGEIQWERLKKNQQVRGTITEFTDQGEGRSLLNVFPTAAYSEEASRILEKQASFYLELTNAFKETYLGLLTRKREYFEGPGSEKSRTDYGRFKKDGRTIDNLFEELIGKDKINNEKRASASSLSAQIYNLLNDLNNLMVHPSNLEDGKLTKEIKEKIIEEAKMNTSFSMKNVRTIIKNETGAKEEDIKGWRIDKNEKAQIHLLKGYREFKKALANIGVEANDLPTIFFDQVADIITLNTEKSEIRKQLEKDEFQKRYPFISEEMKEVIITEAKKFLVDNKANWHSFSYTTLNLLIPELLNTSKEQMTILTEKGWIKSDKEKYKEKKEIPYKKVIEEIYNPVVGKSIKESIKIVNALNNKYGRENIDSVVIELPRESNEEEAKKAIIKLQKGNEEEKNSANKEFIEALGISELILKDKYRKERNLFSKVRFWYQQDHKCVYCGKNMRAEELFSNSSIFDIDHVIPISVSFDDGLNNKVLVHADCNRMKAKETPIAWIQRSGGNGLSLSAYENLVRNMHRLPRTKRENLMSKINLNDMETRKRFIARNLIDTQYASRIVLNELQSYYKANELPTKIQVIRGKWTSQLRKAWKLTHKTRDTHHHHAVDATIIAVSPYIQLFKKHPQYHLIEGQAVDKETGEIMPILEEKEFERSVYDDPYPRFIDQLLKLSNIEDKENPIKFSHYVDKKVNRAVANQTIYGTRKKVTLVTQGRGKNKKEMPVEEEYTFGTIKNIYDIEEYTKFRKLYDDAKKKGEIKFLMQEKDSKTFEKLEKILTKYPDRKDCTQVDGKVKSITVSPFELYRKEHGFLTKYAKKNNGPKVVSLKYYDKKIGNHIDITPPNARNRVLLQSLKPWRTDVYYNPNTQDYELLGLKYKDLRFYPSGIYGISVEDYEDLKKGRSSQHDGSIVEKSEVKEGSVFCFSLYRGDRVKVIDENGESQEFLFASRTTSNPGYVELKPIQKSCFTSKEDVSFYGVVSSGGRFIKKFTRKGYKLWKVNTDILGNPYYTEKEVLKIRKSVDGSAYIC